MPSTKPPTFPAAPHPRPTLALAGSENRETGELGKEQLQMEIKWGSWDIAMIAGCEARLPL